MIDRTGPEWPEDDLPDPDELEREPTGWEALRGRLGRWTLITVVVVVASLVAGAALGAFFPRLIATRSISPLITDEAVGDPDVRVTEGPAPSSGPTDGPGEVLCGLATAPVGVADQHATLAAGVVVLHVAPDADPVLADAVRDLAELPDVLVVDGTPGLVADVDAVAWGRRLSLTGEADPRLLDRFLLAFVDTGPVRGGCDGEVP